MKSLLISIGMLCCLVLGAAAAPVYNTPVSEADFDGSRSIGEGLAGSGVWGLADSPFTVEWRITFDNPFWTYTYTITGISGKDVSHAIVDLSDDCLDEAFGCVLDANGPATIGEYSSADGGSNPNLPNPIIGVKLDFGGGEPVVYTITSLRSPVWGDFYAKDGVSWVGGVKEANAVWNLGLVGTGHSVSEEVGDFIARPNGLSDDPPPGDDPEVPEPGSLLLLGGGLVALGLMRRRR